MADDEKTNLPQRLEEGQTVPAARPKFNSPKEGEEFAKAQTVPAPPVSLTQARAKPQSDNQTAQTQSNVSQVSNDQNKK